MCILVWFWRSVLYSALQQIAEILQQTSRTNFTQFPFKTATKLWRSDFSVARFLQSAVQGFAESLQQECSKPAQNVMIELYCCGPGLDYSSR